jgi:(S)-sulfolactate dehydrogenase
MRSVGYDPQVPAASPYGRASPARTLDELLAEADVVSLHVPLTDSTRNLVDARLARMKPRPSSSTPRGGVIDEAAVASALRAGRLGGAALDVRARTARGGIAARRCPNLILTPHIAGITRESNVRVSTVIADKVAAALAPR